MLLVPQGITLPTLQWSAQVQGCSCAFRSPKHSRVPWTQRLQASQLAPHSAYGSRCAGMLTVPHPWADARPPRTPAATQLRHRKRTCIYHRSHGNKRIQAPGTLPMAAAVLACLTIPQAVNRNSRYNNLHWHTLQLSFSSARASKPIEHLMATCRFRQTRTLFAMAAVLVCCWAFRP